MGQRNVGARVEKGRNKKRVIRCANYTATAVQEYLPSSPVLDHHSQSRKINQTHILNN